MIGTAELVQLGNSKCAGIGRNPATMPAVSVTTTNRRPTGLKEARELLRDLFPPKPGLYWTDLLFSATLGWSGVLAATYAETYWIIAASAVIAVFSLYRSLLFIHELTHLRQDALPGFAPVWNVIVGIPLLVPSFTYIGVHTDHHRRSLYGTPADPEYLPLAHGPRSRIAWKLFETLFLPLAFAVRFLILSPLALVWPRFHRWLEVYASSLVINAGYRRRPFLGRERARARLLELAILFVWGTAIFLAARGIIPWRFFVIWYFVSFGIGLVNQLRTLAAHRFRNDGDELDVLGQLEDTVNVPGGILTALWAPVGLRFHALHHYLPDLPYHALGAAHRRLIESLPSDAPYRATSGSGLFSVLRTLWNEAGVDSRTS